MFTVKVTRRSMLGSTSMATPRAMPRANPTVKVGFPEGTDGQIVMRAVWNEFGTRGGGWGGPIPERPFFRNALRSNEGAYRAVATIAGQGILLAIATKGQAGGAAELRQALSKLGILMQGDIQSEITSLSSPPNSPVTVKLKGSSKPLIDSGQMRAAVTWKIDG